MRGPPTIDRLRATGNSAGRVAAQIRDQLRDFLWLQQAFDCAFCDHNFGNDFALWDAVNFSLGGNLLLDQWGTHVGWADSVASHAMFGTLQSGDAGEADQAMFGGNIGRFKGRCPQTMYGRDVNDASPITLVHAR